MMVTRSNETHIARFRHQYCLFNGIMSDGVVVVFPNRPYPQHNPTIDFLISDGKTDVVLHWIAFKARTES